MLLTVNKYLNIRTGQPSASAANPGYLSPGDNIDLEAVVLGETLDGNAIWYRSKSGYYYWSGGVTEQEFEIPGLTVTDAILRAVTEDILHNYSSYYRNKFDGYLGCGIGKSKNDTIQSPVIAIFIDRPQAATTVTPDHILHKGFSIPIEMITSNPPKFQQGHFFPGNKVAGGTACIKGYYKGSECLLSCYHVMASSLMSANPPTITPENHLSVTLKNGQETVTLPVIGGEFNDTIEYAVAELPGNISFDNKFNEKPIIGYCSPAEIDALWTEMVYACGAYTPDGKAIINYTMRDIQIEGHNFKNVIHTDKLSINGDSGAVVVTNNNKLVGFVFAGDNVSHSYIMPAYKFVPKIFIPI
ncbi:hypothetical protein CLV59_105493 [Chitinophaga dinghuensis]|uniref:Uncharacterized protein n=1 Tax=Chitinophaga dinghuensis TaxID=1539050 RepID=A0A327W055_9BACT|nr:hypothetical protein [Chitinophaga dinghuensis]RAJ80384.1 hypothetical protein CLV59_105493 [Chitinophaga dinghuensis]